MRIMIDQRFERQGLNTIITTTVDGNTTRRHDFFETREAAERCVLQQYINTGHQMVIHYDDSVIIVDIVSQ